MAQARRNREDYSVDSILDLRLSPFRSVLAVRAMMAANPEVPKLTRGEFDRLVTAVRQVLPSPARFDREAENIRAAFETGTAPREPDIAYPETQLLWGAALLMAQGDLPGCGVRWANNETAYASVTATSLWAQVTQTQYALDEMFRHAYYIGESIRNPDTRFEWGEPGTTFYFNPEENRINIDLAAGLILGLEHTRAVNLHEIGHSQMTLKFPPRQREIWAEMEPLTKKADAGESLEPEEYKRLRMLSAEWQLRHRLSDAAENNCVNRNAEALGDVLGQDFGYSLNHTIALISEEGQHAAALRNKSRESRLLKEVFNGSAVDMDALADEMLRRSGLDVTDETRDQMRKLLEEQRRLMEEEMQRQREAMRQEREQKDPGPYELFINTIRAVSMAFFQNNGMIENTVDGWEKLGIHPDMVKAEPPAAANDNGADMASLPDFAQLLELCSGQKGLENMRPTLRDRWYGRDYFNDLSGRMADARNEITEKIWDIYLDRYAKELLKEVEQQVEEELKEQEQQQQQQQEGQEGEGQEGEGQESDGQGQPKPAPGKNGRQQKKKQPGDFDPSKAGTSRGNQKIKVKTGNGQGKSAAMPDVERPPEKPQKDGPGQGNEKDGQGKDKSGGGKGKRGRTLQEIMDEIRRRQEEEARKKAGQKQKGDQGRDGGEGGEDGDEASDEPGDGPPGRQAGEGGKGRTLEEIAKSDWKDYPLIVAELMGVIMQVVRALQKIKEKQLRTDTRRSPVLERLPEGREMDRLDPQAHQDLTIKKATGQPIEERDLDRFRKDETFDIPAQIDIVLMIDGSGSMNIGWSYSKINALEASLLSATILKEAAERVGANVYINMWGSENPVTLAKPGDDSRTIADNIVRARAGLNSGTDFASSIRHITKELAAHSGKGEPYRGYTHIIVFSDGDIRDEKASKAAIDALMETANHVTMDFAIIEDINPDAYYSGKKSAMEELAESLQAGAAAQRVSVVSGSDPAVLPAQVIGLLLDKIRRSESFRAIPATKKKADFRRAQQRMEP